MYQRIVATAMNIYLLIGLRYIRIEGYIPLKLETVFFYHLKNWIILKRVSTMREPAC